MTVHTDDKDKSPEDLKKTLADDIHSSYRSAADWGDGWSMAYDRVLHNLDRYLKAQSERSLKSTIELVDAITADRPIFYDNDDGKFVCKYCENRDKGRYEIGIPCIQPPEVFPHDKKCPFVLASDIRDGIQDIKTTEGK